MKLRGVVLAAGVIGLASPLYVAVMGRDWTAPKTCE